MNATLSFERLDQIDALVDEVRKDPMCIANLFDAAARGDDAPEFTVSTAEIMCVFQLIWIEGVALRDVISEPRHQPKIEFLRHASVDDLLMARQRVLENLRATVTFDRAN